MKISSKEVSVGTFKVNTIVTQEMIDELKAMKSFDEVLKKQAIYEKRKRIIEKILKEDKTNSEK